MSNKAYGMETGDTLVEYPNQPSKDRDEAVWSFTFKYWCKKSKAYEGSGGLIPTWGTSKTVDGASFKLSKVSIQPTEAPDMVDVLLTYSPSGFTQNNESEHNDGDVVQRCETIPLEFSVDDQAVYDAFPSEVAYAKEKGQATITIGGLSYTYGQYIGDFTWSEVNLIEASGIGIGKVGAPTGITSPSDNKWVFRGMEIDNVEGNLTKKTERWEFSPVGWPNGGVVPPS